jgi:hypothetical protein
LKKKTSSKKKTLFKRRKKKKMPLKWVKSSNQLPISRKKETDTPTDQKIERDINKERDMPIEKDIPIIDDMNVGTGANVVSLLPRVTEGSGKGEVHPGDEDAAHPVITNAVAAIHPQVQPTTEESTEEN